MQPLAVTSDLVLKSSVQKSVSIRIHTYYEFVVISMYEIHSYLTGISQMSCASGIRNCRCKYTHTIVHLKTTPTYRINLITLILFSSPL